MEQTYESSPVFDSFDVDLLVKVLSHTAFSEYIMGPSYPVLSTNVLLGPFFTFFIPVFYYFQGSRWPSPILVISSGYYVLVSIFCEWSPIVNLQLNDTDPSQYSGFARWYSRLYRNQGSLLFGPGRFDWGEQIVVITGGVWKLIGILYKMIHWPL